MKTMAKDRKRSCLCLLEGSTSIHMYLIGNEGCHISNSVSLKKRINIVAESLVASSFLPRFSINRSHIRKRNWLRILSNVNHTHAIVGESRCIGVRVSHDCESAA